MLETQEVWFYTERFLVFIANIWSQCVSSDFSVCKVKKDLGKRFSGSLSKSTARAVDALICCVS